MRKKSFKYFSERGIHVIYNDNLVFDVWCDRIWHRSWTKLAHFRCSVNTPSERKENYFLFYVNKENVQEKDNHITFCTIAFRGKCNAIFMGNNRKRNPTHLFFFVLENKIGNRKKVNYLYFFVLEDKISNRRTVNYLLFFVLENKIGNCKTVN